MYVFLLLPRSLLFYYICSPSLSLSWLLHKHVEGPLFSLYIAYILRYFTLHNRICMVSINGGGALHSFVLPHTSFAYLHSFSAYLFVVTLTCVN
jgi:hypothetical protein